MGGKGSVPTPSGASTVQSGTMSQSSAYLPSPQAAADYSTFMTRAMDRSNDPVMSAALGSTLANLSSTGTNFGTFDPSAVHAIESPYTEDVVNATQNWFNNQNDIQGDTLMGNAIKTGNAFGGDRAGIAEAQLGGQQQLAQAPVIAGLRQAGYGQALQEYNTMKQFDLSGKQAAVQAEMTSQQLPYQQLSWLGSALGGIGPLTGTSTVSSGETSNVNTPANPNALTTGLGVFSSLLGLGQSLFGGGKHGGTVGRFATGGLTNNDDNYEAAQARAQQDDGSNEVDIRHVPNAFGVVNIPKVNVRYPGVQNQGNSNRQTQAAPQQQQQSSSAGGLFGGIGRIADTIFGFADGGPIRLPRRYDDGGDVNYDDEGATFSPNFGDDNLDANGTDTGFAGLGNPDSNRDDEDDNDATLIPIHAAAAEHDMAASGAPAGLRFDFTPEPDASGSPAGLPDPTMAGVKQGLSEDPATGSPAGLPNGGAGLTDTPPTEAEPSGLPSLAGGAGGLGDPEQPRNAKMEGDTPGAKVAGLAGDRRPTVGDGGPRGGGTRTLPGLGRQSTFASRAANNPFLSAGVAMLKSRSPFFGQGLGAGLEGAQGALSRTAKQEQLDAKPQMITSGETVQYRVGDKMIDTGIRTQTAASKAASSERQLDRESRERIARDRQDAISGRSGTPSKTEGGKLERERDAEVRRHMQMELNAAKNSGQDLGVDEAERRAIMRWNRSHPDRALPEPPAPAPKAAPAKPKEEPGVIQRGWDYLTKPDPNAPKTAPVTPDAKPPGVPEVKAPAAPDLGAAIKTGAITPEVAIAQAKAAIARNPAARPAVIARLEKAGVDVSSLTAAPAMPVVPISQ